MSPSKTEPTVCAVMLTADRPALARRAVECFRAQTYDPIWRMLLVLDTGVEPFQLTGSDCENEMVTRDSGRHGNAIGTLRNVAGGFADRFEILMHWDDDDWSHPSRIAEQVALLQSSGAEVVGYNEMLFWREKRMCDCEVGKFGAHYGTCTHGPGEAWLYSNPNPGYALGTSLCYKRAALERKPFPATSIGEDLQFCTGRKVVGVPAFGNDNEMLFWRDQIAPRMIARIHAGNTSGAYRPEAMARAKEWRRVPEWDQHCRSVME